MVVAVAVVAVYVYIYLPFYPSIHPSIYLSLYLQVWKRNKTKLFWETYSIFELDNIRSAAILRDFLNILFFWNWQRQKRSNSARLPSILESWMPSWRRLSRKIILANLKIWCSKMQPLPGNQRPDLLTSLMTMSLVPCLPREMHLCGFSSNVPRLPTSLEICNFWQGAQSLLPTTQNDIWTSESAPYPTLRVRSHKSLEKQRLRSNRVKH